MQRNPETSKYVVRTFSPELVENACREIIMAGDMTPFMTQPQLLAYVLNMHEKGNRWSFLLPPET